MTKVMYQLARSTEKKDEHGRGVQGYASSFYLPRIVRHTVQDENGNYVVQKLRYCPASGSILYNDNKNDKSDPIRFDNGFLTVDTNKDPVLYHFLETIDLNGSKKGRNTSKPIIFYRVDNAARAQESIEKATTIAERTQKFFEMSASEKEAIAVLWGVKTHGVDMSVWVYQVMTKVMQDPNKLQELIDKNDLATVGFIAKARRFGLLEQIGKKWYFNGFEIVEVPVGLDPYTHLTSWVNKNQATFETWKTTILEREQLLTAAPAIDSAATKMTGAEALELGMKYKVLTYDRGRGWRFVAEYENMGDEQIFGRKVYGTDSNNKTNAANFLDNNHLVKKEIILRVNAAQEAEKNK